MNLEYAIAQWIWVMAGSDDVAAISYYNPRGWNFTEDQQTLRGAFGYRLRRADGIDQLERIVDRLRRDSASRREIAVVSFASDLRRDIRDQPCLISLQFMIRAQRLDLIVVMRSQSAALVLPYDASLFMTLQCWMAARLGVEPGRYVHFAASFHIYEDEIPLAEALLRSPARPVSIGSMREDVQARTEELIAYEAALRAGVLAGDRELVQRLARRLESLEPGFLTNAARVLAAGAANRIGMHDLQGCLRRSLPTDWTSMQQTCSQTPTTPFRPA